MLVHITCQRSSYSSRLVCIARPEFHTLQVRVLGCLCLIPAGCCGDHPQGKDAVAFLESLVTGDIAGLADGTGSLSMFTNEKGGIIDDTVITKVRTSVA